MPLESVTHIGDLDPANPLATDQKKKGDDHVRNLKLALRNDFAGFTGAICVTGTDGGVANAYTLTSATALVAYGSRMAAVFSPVADNTGACTLDISGLGAKALKSISGAALVLGDLVAGQVYVAVYNGTEFRLLAPTKNYVDQLAFSAALPAQAGKAGGSLFTDGAVAIWARRRTPEIIVFATSGTHTPTVDCWAEVTVQGGGGSGSAGTNTQAGGAGGGTAIKYLLLQAGVTYTVTVGAGGAATTGATGNAGGASSFSGAGITTITANGGPAYGSGGGTGGTATGGDINITGGPAAPGTGNSDTNFPSGASYFSPGGTMPNTNGVNWGAGAGNTYGAGTGKAGYQGVVIIKY